MADLNSKNIDELAENPKRVTVDGNTVEQQSIGDQIKAAEFAATKAALAKNKRGFAIAKLKPPGTV